MNELNVECPHCGEHFELTEAISAHLREEERQKAESTALKRVAEARASIEQKARAEAAKEYEGRLVESAKLLAARDADVERAKKEESAALKAREGIERERQDIELNIQRRVTAERERIAKEAAASARAEGSAELASARKEIADRDQALKLAKQAELDARKAAEVAERVSQDAELEVQRRVDAQREALVGEAEARANERVSVEIANAQRALAEGKAKIEQAQTAELEALKKKQEAEDAKREAELTVARRLDDERVKVREAALKERDDEFRLKTAEKDKQLRELNEQIDELRRKGTSVSQQLVGDVLETDLLTLLTAAFPDDVFERVKVGNRGADVLQTVRSPSGISYGTILWESKRTKEWREPWLSKLREDQREAKADIAALVTETMPNGLTAFGERDQVWVISLPVVTAVAAVLRHALIQLSLARRAGTFTESLQGRVFAYLTSPQFGHQVGRIVEAQAEMRVDLEREKRASTAAFNKREKQLDRVALGVAGFYGDLQGIAGASLPSVEGLTLAAPVEDIKTPTLTSDAGGAGSPASAHGPAV